MIQEVIIEKFWTVIGFSIIVLEYISDSQGFIH